MAARRHEDAKYAGERALLAEIAEQTPITLPFRSGVAI
jgi:hypothetical protein